MNALDSKPTFAEQVKEFEKNLLLSTLRDHSWHRGHAAEALGMTRQRFYQKLWQHGIITRIHEFGERKERQP